MLYPTPAGASNSSISRSSVEDVLYIKLHANAWNEYFIGLIHCNQTIQSSMYGKGTKPPDAARNTTTFADAMRKARSCENIAIEVSFVFKCSG